MPSNTPHFSKVTDLVENINPVTGRSIHYGVRPWRCADRLQDFLAAVIRLEGFKGLGYTTKMYWRCTFSDYGQEPDDNYYSLNRREIMFYVDRYEAGMLRDKFFERYPYNVREIARISQADGTKMRVWRHQRELEIEAKEGKLDEMISSSVKPEKGGSRGGGGEKK